MGFLCGAGGAGRAGSRRVQRQQSSSPPGAAWVLGPGAHGFLPGTTPLSTRSLSSSLLYREGPGHVGSQPRAMNEAFSESVLTLVSSANSQGL